MDDGTTLFPANVDQNLFLKLLNSMHPAIKYTVEQPERIVSDGMQIQRLVFLSLILHLDERGDIWTDVHYKATNTHEYLNFRSHHPDHVKKNIPFVLAKRIAVFTTKETDMKRNFADLKVWLQNCGYPQNVIDRGIHNALLGVQNSVNGIQNAPSGVQNQVDGIANLASRVQNPDDRI